MINVNEMRIGSLVNDPNEGTVSIKAIAPEYMGGRFLLLQIAENKWEGESALEDVPLSVDVLMRCGFQQQFFGGGLKLILNERFSLYIYIEGGGEMRLTTRNEQGTAIDVAVSHINSLHRLQNFCFSLTNKELEIKQ